MGTPGTPDPQQPWQPHAVPPPEPTTPGHGLPHPQPGVSPLPPQPGFSGELTQPFMPQPSVPPEYPSQPLYQAPYGQFGAPYGDPGFPPSRQKSQLPLILGVVGGLVLLCMVFAVAIFVALTPFLRELRQGNFSNANPTQTVTAGTPATASKVVYTSALTSDDGWSTSDKCTFKSDGFHITAAYICYSPADPLADGSVEVTVKEISGARDAFYGVVFRRASKGNYYALDLSSNGQWMLSKVENNNASDLIPLAANSAIKKGTGVENTIRATFNGSNIDITINGTEAGTVDDATFTTGIVGLEGDDSADVAFTNLTLTQTS